MRLLLRPVALLCAGFLAVTALAGSASAAPDRSPAGRSASWLSRQLTHGLIHNDQYDFNDYGLTADTALALVQIGGRPRVVTDIRRALARHVDAWTTYKKEVYAGSVAKALVLAEVTGARPRHYGGVNLVARLDRRVSERPGIVGRIRDKAATDYANTIGQAFAVQGLSRVHSPEAPAARRFLLKQQCSRGYFRLNFAPVTADDQTCDGGDPTTTSAPDTDVTALAVLSLQALPRKTSAVRTAIADAVRWLKRHQRDNGSYGGGPATEGSNTNSTGLAAWALGESGACRVAQRAAQWVKGLEVSGDLSGTKLAGQSGAIAYDRAALRDGRQHGIGVAEQDQWRRATSQAAPALAYLRLAACR